MKRSKKYVESSKKVEKNKLYKIDEAIDLVKQTSTTKFESTIDVVISLNLKEKQLKESVKGSLTLPNNIGKEVKVVVIAENEDQKKATAAGADFVGFDDIIKKIEEGWSDFDILIATPEVMPKIAKLGKYIGKRGLMPNPKNETVTKNVESAVKNFKAGKTNYKMYENGIFQFKFAKVGMNQDAIKENLLVFVDSVKSETKKFGDNVLKSMSISSTMGPSLKIDLNSL